MVITNIEIKNSNKTLRELLKQKSSKINAFSLI